MKSYFLMGLLYLFPLFLSAEDLSQIAIQAEAFFAAKNYEQARELYAKIIPASLSQWQKALIIYNLGTINIAQEQWQEALTHFQAIPQEPVNPLIWRNVAINQGLIYFYQAQSPILAKDTDQQTYLIQQSIKNLEQAQKIDCSIRELEGEKPCQNSLEITLFSQKAQFLLDQVKQTQRVNWFQEANLSIKINLLQHGLKKINSLLEGLDPPHLFQSEYLAYIKSSGGQLLSVWNTIQEQSMSSQNQALLKEALDQYLTTLEALEPSQLTQARQTLAQTQQLLQQLVADIEPDPARSIDQLLANYWLVLIEESLSSEALQQLLDKQNQITKQNSSIDLKETSTLLQTSLEALDTQNEATARFFLSVAFFILENLQLPLNSPSDPPSILAQALQFQIQATQLTRLAQLSQNSNQNVHAILQGVQSEALKKSALFIPNVLKTEKEHFSQMGSVPYPRCQTKPWDQVIPLFEQGQKAAAQAELGLSQQNGTESVLNFQEQALLNWQKALMLLKNPPSEANNEEPPPNQPEENSPDIQNVFQLLQEMHLEDEPVKQGSSKELHTW